MNRSSYVFPHRAIARALQIIALASCLVAGAGLSRSVAHAGGCATPAISASAHNSVLQVKGACFPFPSSVHIAIKDLTTGAVLRNWTTVPVAPLVPPIPGKGQFQYVTQGDARPGDVIRFWAVDGATWIQTVNDTP